MFTNTNPSEALLVMALKEWIINCNNSSVINFILTEYNKFYGTQNGNK